MIIDIHTHIVPRHIKESREKYFTDPLFSLLYSSTKAKLATAEDLIASMDSDGIDISVVLNIGWSDSELCTETNDYIIESVKRYPQRLIGFGTVYLGGELEIAIKEIKRCAAEGMRGIGEMRLRKELFTQDNTTRFRDFVDTIIDNKLVLLIHCSEPVGHQYPGKGDTTPELVYQLIERFPKLTLVCAHWGGGLPFYSLMPEVKKTLSAVMFDTAASPYLYAPTIYRQVVQLVGVKSIIFGSDFPLLGQAYSLNKMRSARLSAEVEERIVSLNAQRLLEITNR